VKPFDLQVNGYAGTDFCSSSLNAEQLHHACRTLADDGVDAILATLITDDLTSLLAKISNLVRLREEDELARQVIAGLHIEDRFSTLCQVSSGLMNLNM
jgi:N-acetylglucosamine-6-phosphate deacetylase